MKGFWKYLVIFGIFVVVAIFSYTKPSHALVQYLLNFLAYCILVVFLAKQKYDFWPAIRIAFVLVAVWHLTTYLFYNTPQRYLSYLPVGVALFFVLRAAYRVKRIRRVRRVI